MIEVVKRFLLTRKTLTDADYIWIQNNSQDFDVKKYSTVTLDTYGGKSWQVAGRPPEIFITTNCPKQESMLYLKYANELVLVSQFAKHEGEPVYDRFGLIT